ncbi:kazal-type serine protease inhibitor domain-containing protein 1-like [Heterodontus francisci]|uniref:kazal-type serine protease inhibitor domain-containing protein 1-like n=1 Tax=Heterodontus francisci TaxID=7792 RepID=UPI00355B7474
MMRPGSLSSLCSLILPLAVLGTVWAAVDSFDYVHKGWQRLLEEGPRCPPCELDQCLTPQQCLAGMVRDSCDCCWECGNIEGQICDLDNGNYFYGRCGARLECRLDLGDLRHGEVPEPRCMCQSNQAVCGSNGKTYPQICKFQEASNGNMTFNITLVHEGPCEGVPQIISPPFNIWNMTGEDVIFSCEIFAYPMAAIEWHKEGVEMFLPGDDPHISVQVRGGPFKYEATGWLLIQRIRKSDSGLYHCSARNELGEVSAAASLTVVMPDQVAEVENRWIQPEYFVEEYSEDYY